MVSRGVLLNAVMNSVAVFFCCILIVVAGVNLLNRYRDVESPFLKDRIRSRVIAESRGMLLSSE